MAVHLRSLTAPSKPCPAREVHVQVRQVFHEAEHTHHCLKKVESKRIVSETHSDVHDDGVRASHEVKQHAKACDSVQLLRSFSHRRHIDPGAWPATACDRACGPLSDVPGHPYTGCQLATAHKVLEAKRPCSSKSSPCRAPPGSCFFVRAPGFLRET